MLQIEIFPVGSAIMIFNDIQNDMTGKQTAYYIIFDQRLYSLVSSYQ